MMYEYSELTHIPKGHEDNEFKCFVYILHTLAKLSIYGIHQTDITGPSVAYWPPSSLKTIWTVLCGNSLVRTYTHTMYSHPNH